MSDTLPIDGEVSGSEDQRLSDSDSSVESTSSYVARPTKLSLSLGGGHASSLIKIDAIGPLQFFLKPDEELLKAHIGELKQSYRDKFEKVPRQLGF